MDSFTGARITGVDDTTYSSTGEAFSTIGKLTPFVRSCLLVCAAIVIALTLRYRALLLLAVLPHAESVATKRLQSDDVSLAYEASFPPMTPPYSRACSLAYSHPRSCICACSFRRNFLDVRLILQLHSVCKFALTRVLCLLNRYVREPEREGRARSAFATHTPMSTPGPPTRAHAMFSPVLARVLQRSRSAALSLCRPTIRVRLPPDQPTVQRCTHPNHILTCALFPCSQLSRRYVLMPCNVPQTTTPPFL